MPKARPEPPTPRPEPSPSPATAAAPRAWATRATSPIAAAIILALFWIGMEAAWWNKSQTFDEGVHVLAGYCYWTFNDYRFNPENGNLPQRIMALPLVLSPDVQPPDREGKSWAGALEWAASYEWLYESGNPTISMIHRGRAIMGLVAVAVAALVWWWARRLFGPLGGMVALLVAVLNPTVLANGPLMTSDTTCALFFLACIGGVWAVLEKVTPWRVVGTGLLMGGLFVSKMSALLLLPMLAILTIVRLVWGVPLPFCIGRREGNISGRHRQAACFAGIAVVQGAIVLATVWGFYGFRFSAFAPDQPPGAWKRDVWAYVLSQPAPAEMLGRIDLTSRQRNDIKRIFAEHDATLHLWSGEVGPAMDEVRSSILSPAQLAQLGAVTQEPPTATVPRILDFLRQHRLLPEAFIYGHAHAFRYSLERPAFLNGDFSVTGWWWFFPYTFLVKTPLPFMALLVLALVAAVLIQPVGGLRRRLAERIWRVLPLCTLIACYGAALLFSHLNIGHRHMLATYPPLFILCGAAGAWFERKATRAGFRRVGRSAVGALLVLLAVDVVWRFPNYLAYFNGIVHPRNGWKHLIDSSLDWGQDLPALKKYLDTRPADEPVYLTYLGQASPAYYDIHVRPLPSCWGPTGKPFIKLLELPEGGGNAAVEAFFAANPEYDPRVVVPVQKADSRYAAIAFRPERMRLEPGTYCIGATALQPHTDTTGPWGPWNTRYETGYTAASAFVLPMLDRDPEARREALRNSSPARWGQMLDEWETLRFHRLTAYLRHRGPDEMVGWSILVYHLTESDIEAAIEGPPAELGPDLPRLLSKQQ